MFDNIRTHRDDKRQDRLEERDRKFTQQRDLFQAGAADDESLYQVQSQKSDLTRWQQDLEDSIEQLHYSLLNYIKKKDQWQPAQVFMGVDEEGNKVYAPMQPMVNEFGTFRIISLVKQYMNRNVMMSNLDEHIILRIMLRLRTTIVLNLGEKYETYEIDPADLSIIVKMVMDAIEATLYRAYRQGERNYLNTINKRVYTETGSPQQQQQTNKGFIKGVFT